MTSYIHREVHALIANAMRTMPVVVITGMRQTGKTTLLQNDGLFKDHQYITLDDFATLSTARAQPDSLIPGREQICIDEAQKAPELLTAIKREVDRNRKPGKFVLSGSANFSLLKGISESLAGRAIYLTLQPFSRRELQQATKQTPLIVKLLAGEGEPRVGKGIPLDAAEILRGGMPPVKDIAANDQSTWFRGFEQTYVERDIRDIARIDDVLGFRNIIRMAALRSGQIVNLSGLARDARLSLTTTARYMQLAEASFLVRMLPPFLRNRTSRLIKSPKLYFADSGLAAHLAGIEGLEANKNEPLRGAMFETYALQNISAMLEAHLPDARISFWHVQGRYEVDFVLEHKRSCVAVEVKAAGRWSEGDVSALRILLEKTPSCSAAILAYNGDQTARLGPKLWAVPLGTLLL